MPLASGPQRLDGRPAAFSMVGGAIGIAGGPFLGLLVLIAMDVVDPDGSLSLSISLVFSALLPSVLLLALAALGPRRWRPLVVGLAAGTVVSCLVLAVPLMGMDAVFGDF